MSWHGDVLRFEGVWAGSEKLPDDVLLEHFASPTGRCSCDRR